MSETEPRIIKKYPNRRLYDTQISRYITLEEIRELVIEDIPFVVVDKRTHEDITRSILLQVINEQEQGGDPILSTKLLTHIIRFYGDSMQNAASHYLEMSLQMFMDQSQQFKDRLRGLLNNNNPLQALKEMSQLNRPIWKSVRREFLKNLNRGRGKGPSPDSESTAENTKKVAGGES